MEAFFGALLVVSSVVAIHLYSKHSWKRTAERLGLFYSFGMLTGNKIQGEIDGAWVKIKKTDNKGCSLTVDGRGRISHGLELGKENLFTRTMAPDILTGDSAFDYDVRITGNEALSLAVLNHTTRQVVLRTIVAGGAKVERGRIQLLKPRLSEVERAVPGIVELAKQIEMDDAMVAANLAANAVHDPHQGVRLRNLRVLLDGYRNDEITAPTCRKLLSTAQPDLRLEAAVYLGEEGLDVVTEIARSDTYHEDHRVRAVESLVRASRAEQTGPLLDELLDVRWSRIRRVAINGLGRFRYKPAVPRLQALIRSADPGTAEDIAIALSRIGDPAGEPGLLLLLEHANTRVRTAAVRGLALVGTLAAVEPLMSLTSGLALSPLAREAKAAIEQIQAQARISGGEHGQLSVAAVSDDHEGALSPAGDTADGQLSLADNPEDEG
jgi:hypothetical protein